MVGTLGSSQLLRVIVVSSLDLLRLDRAAAIPLARTRARQSCRHERSRREQFGPFVPSLVSRRKRPNRSRAHYCPLLDLLTPTSPTGRLQEQSRANGPAGRCGAFGGSGATSTRICSTRCIGARGARCIGTIGTVYPGTLFIGGNGVFLCIPMKIGVKFEHCAVRLATCRGAP
jgi:hypothetical protein